MTQPWRGKLSAHEYFELWRAAGRPKTWTFPWPVAEWETFPRPRLFPCPTVLASK